MASSDIDICNQALVRLGQSTISSLSEDNDASRTCAQLYPTTRGMVLTMHPWRFATAKVQLARLTDTPVNEWAYAYQLPTDALVAPVVVFDSASVGAQPFKLFEIFQDHLYTDAAVIVVDYRFLPDESKFPEWFVHLLALALASAIAPEITDSAKLATLYREMAFGTPSEGMMGGYFAVASSINDQGNPPNRFQDFALTQARFS